jgi:hypothetical protein
LFLGEKNVERERRKQMKKLFMVMVLVALSTQAFAATVVLTWTPLNDGVTKINVYSTTAAGCATLIPKTPVVAPWGFVNSVAVPVNTDSIPGLTTGIICFYATAANSTDESQPSNVVAARIPLPVPVLNAPVIQ